MYGTIARLRIKPGTEERLSALAASAARSPDQIAEYVFRLDNEPDTFLLVVIFASEEAYRRHAARPETHAGYERMAQYLAAPPEWHDGAIVFDYARGEAVAR